MSGIAQELSTDDLVFVEADHAYYFRGTRIVSVTQAISAAGLIDSEWFTEYSRERGRAVHLATQFDDEGDLDPASLSPVIAPYFEAHRRFKRETGFVPQMIESRFCRVDQGYAGTFDRFGLMGGKRKAIVDYKTGPIAPWTRLQLAAYCASLPGAAGFERYAVRLCDDGTYKMKCFPISDFRQDLNDFLTTVRIAQLQEECGCQRY